MSQHNHIEGTFRLRTPLHCSSPDKSLAQDNETPTVQMRIVTSQGERRIPYFPANDLRGRLRRKAAKIVLDHICATSKVSVQLYAGLCAGAVSGQPEGILSIEEALRAGRNVYMGLFGGGNRLIRSRYSCQDLVPILQETIDIGMVPEAFGQSDHSNFLPMRHSAAGDRPMEGWSLVQHRHFLRIDDVMRVMRPDEMQEYIADVVSSVTHAQESTFNESQARKGDKAKAETGEIKASDVKKKTDIGNIMGLQSIAAGTPMYFFLDFFDETSDAQVGLMLMALRDLVAEQRLGGWGRAGMGKFSADLTLKRHGESLQIFSQTHAAQDAALSPAVAHLVQAAQAEIAELSQESLSAFFSQQSKKETKEQ